MRLQTLNGLRAIAVVMVLLSHALDSCQILGNYGVTIFFILSGFVVTQSIEKSEHLRTVYINRFVRLYPALFVFCGLGLYFIQGFQGDILSYLGYSYNYKMLAKETSTYPAMVHFWSLCVEAHFYCVFPAVIWFLDKKKAVFGIIITIAAFTYVSFLESYSIWVNCSYFKVNQVLAEKINNWFYFSTIPNIIPILVGALFYYLRDQIKGLTIPLGLAIMGIFWGRFVKNHFNSEYFDGFVFAGQRIFFCSAIFLITIYHEENRGWEWIGVLLKDKILEYISKISYGIYLYHFVFYTLMPQNKFQAAIITIVVADLSFRLIENPISRLVRNEGHRNAKRESGGENIGINDEKRNLAHH